MRTSRSFDPLHPWRDHPDLQRVAANCQADQVEVLLHDGGPRLGKTKPEVALVEIEAMPQPGLFEGRVLSPLAHLETVQQGDRVLLIIPKPLSSGLRVSQKYWEERPHWAITPCKNCGLDELFAAPSELIPATFPNLPAGATLNSFTTFCGVCGGTQVVYDSSLRTEADVQQQAREKSVASIVITCLLCAALGATPGLILFFTIWSAPAPLVISVLGALIGGALCIPGVSAERVGKTFAAAVIAKNLPMGKKISKELIDVPAEGDVDPVSKWISLQLIQFVTPDCPQPHNWIMFAGLACGAMVGGLIAAHDMSAIGQGDQGFILPLAGSKDSLATQAILVALGIAIWGGGLGGLIASVAYRRYVIVGLGVGALGALFMWLLLLAGNSDNGYLATFCIASVLSIGVSLIAGYLYANLDLTDETSTPPDDSFDA